MLKHDPEQLEYVPHEVCTRAKYTHNQEYSAFTERWASLLLFFFFGTKTGCTARTQQAHENPVRYTYDTCDGARLGIAGLLRCTTPPQNPFTGGLREASTTPHHTTPHVQRLRFGKQWVNYTSTHNIFFLSSFCVPCRVFVSCCRGWLAGSWLRCTTTLPR